VTSALGYLDVRPVLERLSDLERELVLVGGQAVNFWATLYERRVPALARKAPFTSKDIDFCGDQQAVRLCAARLHGTPRLAGSDDATPNSGVVTFLDDAGFQRTLDVVSAPFGLQAKEVRETAIPVTLPDASGSPSGTRFFVIHPVLNMESRVHNVAGLASTYDTPQGRKQLAASIVCAREFLVDILDGRFPSDDPVRTVLKLNERIVRFCIQDRSARELHHRLPAMDPARALLDHARLPPEFRKRRLPQILAQLAARDRLDRGPDR
jgi:hypothetical protein